MVGLILGQTKPSERGQQKHHDRIKSACCVKQKQALLGSHLPGNDPAQTHRCDDQAQLTIYATPTPNHHNDRSAYALKHPFRLQSEIKVLPLLLMGCP